MKKTTKRVFKLVLEVRCLKCGAEPGAECKGLKGDCCHDSRLSATRAAKRTKYLSELRRERQ